MLLYLRFFQLALLSRTTNIRQRDPRSIAHASENRVGVVVKILRGIEFSDLSCIHNADTVVADDGSGGG